jgi:EmrB/QacA subfamily drug resistance transporter
MTEKPKESFFKKWAPLGVLSLALAIIILDSTILNVSLATIIREVNTDIQSIQWVITAYTLTLAALMITGGRLGDLFGRKRMFIIGAFIFAVGSFIMSIANTVPVMIIGESIIEGIGAALMMPATASLLVSKYHGRDRGLAFGVWGGIGAASSAIGPLLGGYLTTNYSWRWSFRINVFVVAILILGSILIEECRETEEKPKLDLPAVLLSSLGLLAVVFGIIESTDYGWVYAKKAFVAFGHTFNFAGYSISIISLLIGLAVLGLFLLWERSAEKRKSTPLVSLTIFKNRQFTSGSMTTGILALGQAGLIFSLPVFLQAVRGETAFNTGLALVPLSLTALIIAPIAGFLSHKYITPKALIQAGLVSTIIGYYILTRTLTVDTANAQLIPAMMFMGAGIGLAMAQLGNLTLSAVSIQQAGEASGLNNTFRQLGQTLGTAIIGAVLLSAISTNLTNGINNSTVIPEKAKNAINESVSSQTSNVEFGGGAKTPAATSPAIKDEIISISHHAITEANKKALNYALFIVFLGLGASFFLPGKKEIEQSQDLARK